MSDTACSWCGGPLDDGEAHGEGVCGGWLATDEPTPGWMHECRCPDPDCAHGGFHERWFPEGASCTFCGMAPP